jgi:BolA protein
MSEVSYVKPIEASIRTKLTASLNPTFFDVINESYKHNVPAGSESHFNVVVVSDQFEGKSLIQRHRMVNHALGDELKNSVHALSIQARTPAQWSENSTVNKTPNCLGGDK